MGHQSCPYCKGDLNILPPESNPAVGASATAYTCSMLSGLASLVTRPFALFREYRERRRQQHQHRQRDGLEGGEEDEGHNGAVELTSSPPSTAAVSPAVLPMVVA